MTARSTAAQRRAPHLGSVPATDRVFILPRGMGADPPPTLRAITAWTCRVGSVGRRLLRSYVLP
jgi:hypothetical protein